jgi:hypothetical protein
MYQPFPFHASIPGQPKLVYVWRSTGDQVALTVSKTNVRHPTLIQHCLTHPLLQLACFKQKEKKKETHYNVLTYEAPFIFLRTKQAF